MNLGPRPVRVATRQPHGGGPARAVATIALIAALLGLAGCSTVSQRITRVEHRSLDVPIGAHTDLSVVTFNGHVNVTAIGEGTADVSVTAFGRGLNKADAQTAADAVTVSIDEQPGALIVSAQPRPGTPAGATNGADVDVVLPPNSSLKLVSSNGRVEAINVRGSVVVSTSNGEVVTRGGKDILVETTNGTITMSGPAGSIRAHTSNAAVDVLDGDRVVADIRTMNGPITFSGSLDSGDHAFQTANASVSLRLPGDQGFSIQGHTSNAAAVTDFPLGVQGPNVSGTVGDGSARVVAETSNATLSVTRLVP